ncbi:hypothetical protein TNCV_2105781 [Trichonephila clavipes]|nr:hypothetical protein TNCV_2105781 [Trichonephila clavipes]
MASHHSCSMFVVDHTIENAPICDAASRVAAAMVSELRNHVAASVVELFKQTLVALQTTPIFESGPVKLLHDQIRLCGNMPLVSAASDKGPLKSGMAFCITLLDPPTPYSASSR